MINPDAVVPLLAAERTTNWEGCPPYRDFNVIAGYGVGGMPQARCGCPLDMSRLFFGKRLEAKAKLSAGT
jgi:hypothetical protein